MGILGLVNIQMGIEPGKPMLEAHKENGKGLYMIFEGKLMFIKDHMLRNKNYTRGIEAFYDLFTLSYTLERNNEINEVTIFLRIIRS